LLSEPRASVARKIAGFQDFLAWRRAFNLLGLPRFWAIKTDRFDSKKEKKMHKKSAELIEIDLDTLASPSEKCMLHHLG
jgi:hypothetical protein